MDRKCGLPVFTGVIADFGVGYLVKSWKLKILPTFCDIGELSSLLVRKALLHRCLLLLKPCLECLV